MIKISIIIPSYNHGKYISYTIQSVLRQTYQNFEIIITDDGSTDNTVAEIEKFSDRRIKLFRFNNNRGVCVALNNCIFHSKGQYISYLNSDDAFYPTKIEKQVKYLDMHPEVGAVFTQAVMIDENNAPLADSSHFHGNMNQLQNRSRFEWLSYFFNECKWLWHPSMTLRKNIYQKIGVHNPCLAQIQDFDLGVRLSLHYEQYIIQERLTEFRIRDEKKNASAYTYSSVIRSMFEFSHVLPHYLSIPTVKEFLAIFPKAQEKYHDITARSLIPFYVAREALDAPHDFHHRFALDTLFQLLQNPLLAAKIRKKSHFDYPDFITLTGKCDIHHVQHIQYQEDKIQQMKKEIERGVISLIANFLHTLHK